MLYPRNEGIERPNAAEKAHFGADDIGWEALAPAIACTLLATVAVAARWYSRCKLAGCVGVDDYVILLPLILAWGMTATTGISVHRGIGTPQSSSSATQIAKLVVVNNVLWILIVNITKASLLTQYLRIFCSTRTRQLCYVLLLALVPAASWAIFGGVFLCSPTAKLWDPDLEGTCRSAEVYWLSVAGLDIGLDFLVLLLPLPAITTLRLPPRQKVGLVLVFTLGFFVCAVSIVRLCTVYITAQQGEYAASGLWAIIWSSVEANVGIICACLLALKPLAAKWWPGLFDETRLARHSMHLKPVDTSGARWSQVDVSRRGRGGDSGGVPETPSSAFSGKDGVSGTKRWSSARTWVPPSLQRGPDQGLSELENVGVVEEERSELEMREHEQGVSIWDMLERPGQVAFAGD